jgi:hypothetical protein
MQAQARKLSPRIVEGIQATKSAISSGTTSGWGSSLALQELSGAIMAAPSALAALMRWKRLERHSPAR